MNKYINSHETHSMTFQLETFSILKNILNNKIKLGKILFEYQVNSAFYMKKLKEMKIDYNMYYFLGNVLINERQNVGFSLH